MICKLLKQIVERFEDIHYEGKQGDPAACSGTW